MTTYKVVAFDMDGTILNNDHELSEKTIMTLRELSSKASVVIATGRSVPSITKYMKQLKLNQKYVYCIAYNGSGIYKYDSDNNDNDNDSMEYLESFPLQPDAVRLLVNLTANESTTVLQCYNAITGEVSVKQPKNEEQEALCNRYESLVGRRQTRINDYEEVLGKASAKCLVLTNDPDSLISKANLELPADTFHIIKGSPYPFFVEFLPTNVNKSSSLKVLCDKYLNINMQDVITFGDGDNDAEMLRDAGLGYAMLNANDNVKLAANRVTEKANFADGVAIEIEKLLSSGAFD